MRTLAILPVKRFELAKQRLSAELEPVMRRQLAEAMVSDVLVALCACASITQTLVVTNEARVSEIAAAHGVLTVADPDASGQSPAALVGIEVALKEDFQRALLVPGDCPALDPGELDELLASASPPPSMVIVPDRHATGTNALLLNPPNAILPTFGPGSFRRHRDRAFAAGAEAQVRELPSLLLDIDTPRDLLALREVLHAQAGHARSTRAVLARMS